MKQQALFVYLENQLQQYYQELAKYNDASPAKRMRIEGQVQLLLDLNMLDKQKLQNLVEKLYLKAVGEKVSCSFWWWGEQQHCFRLPYQTAKAPVK